MTDITDTLEENSASDIVADAKAWLADIGGGQRLQTHSGNCHKWHSTCLVGKLTREIERLRTLATHDTPAQGSVHGEGTVGERQAERVLITQAILDDNEKLRAEIAQLQEAIRRLADQDATLSIKGGDVIVTMDTTLTDEEREALEFAVETGRVAIHDDAILRKLLERLNHDAAPEARAAEPESSVPPGSVAAPANTPTLTDAEREAVEQTIDAANGMAPAEPWTIATLRNLLERLA